MKQDLQRMYGATPDSFKQSVASALKQTEVQPMKKYATRTLVLAAALVLGGAGQALPRGAVRQRREQDRLCGLKRLLHLLRQHTIPSFSACTPGG